MKEKCQKLSRKEAKVIADASFNEFSKELFKTFQKAGCPDLKAISLSYDVSQYLAKKVARHDYCFNRESFLSRAKEVQQCYLKGLEEKFAKRQNPTYEDILYNANDALVELLQDEFEISFSINKRAILPGCFEFGKRR